MADSYGAQRTCFSSWTVRLAVILPFAVALTIAILLGLLGIFVAWLCIVGFMVTSIVVSDLMHRSARYFARPALGTGGLIRP
jgi:hypothetical protein